MPSKEHIAKNIKKIAEMKKKERESKFLAIKAAIIRHHGHEYKAIEEVGVPHKTYTKWRNDYPEFDAMIKEAMEYLIQNAEATVFTLSDEGNLEAAKYVLSRKARDRGWGDKIEVGFDIQKEIIEWLERVRK